MNPEIEFSKEAGYLFVKAHCEWTIPNAEYLIDQSRIEAEKHGLTRILFDLSNWSTPKSETVRFYSGEYLAKVFRAPFKIAAYANPEHINKFGENVAVNRGTVYAIFALRADALAWLMN